MFEKLSKEIIAFNLLHKTQIVKLIEKSQIRKVMY